MTNKISTNLVTFKEGEAPDMEMSNEGLQYEVDNGELVDVVYWCRWPNYDFIFGIPHPTNPKHALEVGFFQYRNTRHKEVKMGFYVDCAELSELATGFARLVELGKVMHPILWNAHLKKSE